MKTLNSYKFIITGKVQGVYYRKTIKENANELKFNGYVKNLSDGSVEAVVTCEENKLEEFKKILEKGSKNSNVIKIVQSNIKEVFSRGFNIQYQ